MSNSRPHGNTIQLTPEIIKTICDAVEEEGTLRFAETRKRLPHDMKTINRWRKENPEFEETLNKSREIGYETLIEETLIFAWDESRDVLEGKNHPTINHNAVTRDKLKIDSIYRRIAAANPEKYSDGSYKSTRKKQAIPGFSKAQTAAQKFDVLCKGIEKGQVSPESFNMAISLCDFQFKREEMAQVEERLRALEKSKQ